MMNNVQRVCLLGWLYTGLCVPLSHAQSVPAEKQLQFAHKLFDDKLYALAAQQFDEFVARHPNHEQADEALFLSGEGYYAAGDYNTAFAAYTRLELGYPRSEKLPRARMRMAECREHLSEDAVAAELFRRVARFHPESDLAARALLRAAQAYERASNREAALSTYFEVVRSFPDAPERINADLGVINLYFKAEQFRKALEHVDAVFRRFGPEREDARILNMRGQVFLKLGQKDDAAAMFAETIERFPDSDEADQARHALIRIYHAGSQADRVEDLFQQLLSRADTDTERGNIYLLQGKLLSEDEAWDEALDALEKAKGLLDARHLEVNFRLAETHRALGNFSRSVTYYRTVLRAFKDSTNADQASLLQASYLGLIEAYAKSAAWRDVLSTIQAYQGRFPNARNARLAMQEAGIVAKRLRDYTRAIRLYDAVMQDFPRSPRVDEAERQIGLCYEGLGQFSLAVREYEKYQRLFAAGDASAWVAARLRLIRDVLRLDPGEDIAVLAKLLRGLVGEHDALTSKQVARIYYDAKEYKLAIAQLKSALHTLQDGEADLDRFRLLGMAYYQLSRKQALLGSADDVAALRDSAAIALDYYINNQPDTTLTEEAHLILSKIVIDKAQNATKRTAVVDSLVNLWRQRYPQGARADDLLILQSRTYFELAKGDTVQLRVALRSSDAILEHYPQSPYREEASFRKAMALCQLHPDSAALAVIDTVIAVYSDSRFMPAALLTKSGVMEQLGHTDMALELLHRIAGEYYYTDTAVAATLRTAELQEKQGNVRDALESYREYRKLLQSAAPGLLHARHADLHLKQAELLERVGNAESALKNYLLYLKQSPTAEQADMAKLAVARIARALKNEHLAREYYEKIAESAGDATHRARALFALGEIDFARQNFADARKHFLQAATTGTSADLQRQSMRFAVRCLYKHKQMQLADAEAKAFRQKYDDTKQDEGQFLLDKAHAYKSDKNFELAEKFFKKVAKTYKRTELGAQGEFGLGSVYLITNHTEDALRILTDIPQKYPDSEVTPLTYFNLGDFYFKSQQVENAIHAFKKVMAHEKARDYRPKAMLYLTQCYNDVGMWDAAIALTRQFLEEYPESEHSFRKQMDIANYLMKLKDYARAIELLTELQPAADQETEAELQFYLGQCYKEMGDFKRATAEFLKVKYLTRPTKLPWHVTALFEAGRCLARLGEVEQSRKMFNRIIREQGADSNFGKFARQQLAALDEQK